MDLKRTAREVLENVGGEENIISIMSCFTRVRVELKDKTKVDEKKLKEADGCQGVNWVEIQCRLFSADDVMMSMMN